MKKVSLMALVFCLFIGVVNAQIITVQVTAEITRFEDHGSYFDDSISVGTPLIMTYSYDTEAEGVMVTQTTMSYSQMAPNYIKIEAGNYSFFNEHSFNVSIHNGSSDSYKLGTSNMISENLPTSAVLLSLIDDSGMIFSDYSLPAENLSVSNWDICKISIQSERQYSISANIEHIIIPEPATFSLLSVGGLILKRFKKGKVL